MWENLWVVHSDRIPVVEKYYYRSSTKPRGTNFNFRFLAGLQEWAPAPCAMNALVTQFPFSWINNCACEDFGKGIGDQIFFGLPQVLRDKLQSFCNKKGLFLVILFWGWFLTLSVKITVILWITTCYIVLDLLSRWTSFCLFGSLQHHFFFYSYYPFYVVHIGNIGPLFP